ncbi:hypothetical protein WOLCODRAFT_148199 [Wolfiporia cocos MD-104 SS10]|uniref:Uncharacterized protein n=1 Tax=Wolfiporia cocos (strain MD-104) TaxID=742152 RepID=A0A2H3IXG5_WOLCO|nr:hypothetical protein WOLCODRAFT_148199 [Wolfiporia cocos MD-104 SS10]
MITTIVAADASVPDALSRLWCIDKHAAALDLAHGTRFVAHTTSDSTPAEPAWEDRQWWCLLTSCCSLGLYPADSSAAHPPAAAAGSRPASPRAHASSCPGEIGGGETQRAPWWPRARVVVAGLAVRRAARPACGPRAARARLCDQNYSSLVDTPTLPWNVPRARAPVPHSSRLVSRPSVSLSLRPPLVAIPISSVIGVALGVYLTYPGIYELFVVLAAIYAVLVHLSVRKLKRVLSIDDCKGGEDNK